MNTQRLAAAREHIDDFLNEKEGLADLIKNLEILLMSIHPAPSWQNDIRQHWGVLEEIYSMSAVYLKPISQIERTRILLALDHLIEILDTQIAATRKGSDLKG
jgi:hypothetical protein